MTMTAIFEPELAFLEYGCSGCGGRFPSSGDLDLHQRETCPRRLPNGRVSPFTFELPHGLGVHDGGRKT